MAIISSFGPLLLGHLKVALPIIQGGMGVKISTAPLAAAVANCGAAGTIAGVGLGEGVTESDEDPIGASIDGLRREIRRGRELSPRGIIGVNIMVALGHYEEAVRASVAEGIDFIASGAGLPLRLPEYVGAKRVALLPIVSSGRAAELIIRTWHERYERFPDGLIVEGPMAGGHLGFKYQDLIDGIAPPLEQLVAETIAVAERYEKEFGTSIPVIAAGGIFDGKDIARFLKMGVKGVQMATRFVATHECEVSEKFKQAYLMSRPEDVVIIKSPVGMPGRAVRTAFTDRVARERVPFNCPYRCLLACDPRTAPYCIARALFKAFDGTLDEAVVFAGANVHRVHKVVSVRELIQEVAEEAAVALGAAAPIIPE